MDTSGFRPFSESGEATPVPISPIQSKQGVNPLILRTVFVIGGLVAFLAVMLWPTKKPKPVKEVEHKDSSPVIHIHNHAEKRVVAKKEKEEREELKKIEKEEKEVEAKEEKEEKETEEKEDKE